MNTQHLSKVWITDSITLIYMSYLLFIDCFYWRFLLLLLPLLYVHVRCLIKNRNKVMVALRS